MRTGRLARERERLGGLAGFLHRSAETWAGMSGSGVNTRVKSRGDRGLSAYFQFDDDKNAIEQIHGY